MFILCVCGVGVGGEKKYNNIVDSDFTRVIVTCNDFIGKYNPSHVSREGLQMFILCVLGGGGKRERVQQHRG